MECLICGIKLKFLGSHLMKYHNMTQKDYYDKYIKKPNEEYCKNCGKQLSFIKLSKGYGMFCSTKCQAASDYRKDKIKNTCLARYGVENIFQTDYAKEQSKKSKKRSEETQKQNNFLKYGVENIWQRPDIIDKIRLTRIAKNHKYEQENNCTLMKTLVNMYGEGWKQNKVLNIPRIYYNHTAFIDNSYLDKIKEYYENHNKGCASEYEIDLIKEISSIYDGKIIKRSRKIIQPQELDIYLPELKLAIEFNGTYWHQNIDIKYHLNKSIKCRELGIRLIHIYQFEDFDVQKQLLKDLILGQDNYPKNDFNKNNFISIPTPEIIYKKDNNIIYGAGKLF